MDLSDLKGIGPVRSDSLRAVGIVSLRDLLYTLPVRYEDHHTRYPCNTSEPGMYLMEGEFREAPKSSYFHGLSRVTCTLHDDSGKVSVCWYNEPWIAKQIQVGKTVRLFGRLNVNHTDAKGRRRVFQNPKFVLDDGWLPVYRALKGFPAKSFRELIQRALENLDECCPETLPGSLRMEYRLCELNYALRQAHFPDSMEALKTARRRLSFERILTYLIYVSASGAGKKKAAAFELAPELTDRFWEALSFQPTRAQKRVLNEIADDLRKSTAMSRMVQGDVGCGKTAVAFGAICLAWRAGYQASMMAPTEILARQHYQTAKAILEPMGVRVGLLTGETKTRERREILRALAAGEIDALFGTHALISRDVNYHRLALVITDEQHRFGVNQRIELEKKGSREEEELYPHVLVMSATPIPRSLALILYGDLDLSLIDELPAGRIPVRTRMVPEEKRSDMYRFLKEQVQRGKQAYIVCPLVESDGEEQDEVKSARTVFSELTKQELAGLNVGLTWGSQKAEEKEKVLREFTEGTIQVLVATTVIEVGVNNPNATIMIIENAERFGLSQLHQLRGRVGRGQEESWCFLVADTTSRLQILCSTNDGFVISQTDLEQRGPGDLIGTRQSGTPMFSMIDTDVRLLNEVTDCVKKLHRDPKDKETVHLLEEQAREYFRDDAHRIAVN